MDRKARTILCLEADSAQRKERAAALENAGYKVIVTHDVREALRIFISRKVDAVLLELRLGNGKKKSLRAEMNSIRPGVPIIALSPPNLKSSGTRGGFNHTFRDGKGYARLIAILGELLGGDADDTQ